MSREKQIQEARTIEAMKKGYMGLEGKFCVIAKWLGKPIIHHGSQLVDETPLFDPFEEIQDSEIPTFDESESSFEVGTFFDGLSRGVNLSIFVNFELREIKCYFEDRVVYKETAGELEGFNPQDIWEENIEKLYSSAKKIEKERKQVEKRKLIEKAEKNKKSILEYLKNKWGI
jgi:hypothetical protein